MNSSHVNIHDYCSNYRNLQNFRLANVDNFWAYKCKFDKFFY